jgi:hypothetical protein
MKQFVVRDLKLNGETITFEKLAKHLDWDSVGAKIKEHKWKRKFTFNDNIITWAVYESEYYVFVEGKKYSSYEHAAKALNSSKITLLEYIREKGKKFKIKGKKVEFTYKEYIFNDRIDNRPYTPRNSDRKVCINPINYDLINFKGIKIVRKLFDGRLVSTYSFEAGAKFLNKIP